MFKKALALIVTPVLVMSSLAEAKGSGCRGAAVVGFTGDILVHGALYKAILPQKSFMGLWSPSIPLFQKADYMIGNLEGPAALGVNAKGKFVGDVGFVYDLNVYSGTNFVFNYHPQILTDLKRSGFDLLSHANNHSLDRRSLGVDKTHEAAQAAQMPLVGTRPADSAKAFYELAQVKGISMAFISCTYGTNGMPDPKGQVLLCFDKAQTVAKLVTSLSAQRNIDAVVVMPHWGEEYAPTPNSSQKSYAKAWLEAGATAIVGHHPHVLQPWESYTTRDGRQTLIVYSLGNFVAGQSGVNKQTGAVVYLKFARGSKGQVDDYYYTPTYRSGASAYPAEGNSPGVNEAIKYFGGSRRITTAEKIPGC